AGAPASVRRRAQRRAGRPRPSGGRGGARAALAAPRGRRLMPDRPSASELADAVREFLEAEVLPSVQDARLRFRLLVAANALSIAKRDLEMGDDLLREEFALLRPLGEAPPTWTPRDDRRCVVEYRMVALCTVHRSE